MAVSVLVFFFLSQIISVELTELNPNEGLKYYIIGAVVLGILLGVVVISLVCLCWCCRMQKPKEETTIPKTPLPQQITQPKVFHMVTSQAPRRDFLKRDNNIPYSKKPRLLNREESTL